MVSTMRVRVLACGGTKNGGFCVFAPVTLRSFYTIRLGRLLRELLGLRVHTWSFMLRLMLRGAFGMRWSPRSRSVREEYEYG